MTTKTNYIWLDLGDVDLNIITSLKMAIVKLKTYKRSRLKSIVKPRHNNVVATVKAELKSVSHISHQVLFQARTVFPFDVFPDTVVIDREKLTIVQRIFFFTARIISVPVRDILGVELSVGPFFGSINITSRYYRTTTPHIVKYLWRSDAFKLQRLVQGYVIANERKIDCTNYCFFVPAVTNLF